VGTQRKRGADSPFTRRQQIINLVVSLVVAFVVMAVTEDVVWGFVTFMLAGVAVNVAMLVLQRK
jgi:hypothetical protein